MYLALERAHEAVEQQLPVSFPAQPVDSADASGSHFLDQLIRIPQKVAKCLLNVFEPLL